MKATLFTFLTLIMLAASLGAQSGNTEDYDLKIFGNPAAVTESKVYFGIFTQNLTWDIADEMGYNNTDGVLITGVVDDSPASEHGLREGDIITHINGSLLKGQDDFDQIRSQLMPGDEIMLTIWREGDQFDMNMVMQPRPGKTVTKIEKKIVKKSGASAYSGGSYVPMWFTPEVDDVNAMLGHLGFDKLNEDGLFMQGMAGRGPVGKNFFIGGMLVTYSDSYTVQNTLDASYHDYIKYDITFGGVTLEKAIPLGRKVNLGVGVMLGGGGHAIELIHSNADYTWPENDSTFFNTGNYQATIQRNYLAVQPKAEILISLLPWLGIRAEAGYAYGYAPKKGWRVKGMGEDTFAISGSPNTPFQGLTLSIGPWFSF